ncbi:TraR/DksA C4-type zinc finger protein [Aneurinibacillus sp. REN35]|uniref:TraR/DksA C4-type zinc finger protein n=1 Tax=Aneurinibacillus sp. REN35 TaxID=3237286 RepID=UPI0035286C36
MLTNQELSHYRSLLTKQQQDLQERLQKSDAYGMSQAAMQESVSELSNYDNHPADLASEMFEREKDLALYEHEEEEMRDITRALEAIDRGVYGICEVCRAPIPTERLAALPTTTRCMEHADERFVSKRRPAEEDILAPAYGQFEYDEADATLYDAEDAWQDVSRYGTSDSPSDFFDPSKLDYDDMYIEADESVGYVEDIEGLALADLDGHYIGPSLESPLRDRYEAVLDEANDMYKNE